MRTIRSFALWAVLIAGVAGATVAGRAWAAPADDKSPGGEKEQKLIAVLKSDAPPQEKAITCKRLAIDGTKDAIPALAPLLADEHLASWARIALEAIPDPAAGDALREALGKVQGRLLVGVINSLAVRREAKAVDDLVAKLKDADADVACAAAEALGRIGGPAAAKALEPLLGSAPAPVRSSAAYACVLAAERMAADGKRDDAAKLYDAVRKAEVPKQRVLEATRGAILARQAQGVPLLVELLRSEDEALFGIGLTVARELPGPEATEALVAELVKAAPARRALLLPALADRGDAKVLPAVLNAAKAGPKDVRIAAMSVLDRLGNASCVPALLDAAADADADVSQAAKGTLVRMSGADVDTDLAGRLAQAPAKARSVLIDVLGQRRSVPALPAIVRCTDDADAAVRAAAVDALGAMGDAPQAADLVKLLQKTADAKDRAAIEKALMSISGRAGAAAVPALAPLLKEGETPLRAVALHALASAGGPEALAAVKAALDDKDEAVQDEAVRTLSTWPNRWPDDAAVAEPLLALAKSAKKAPMQVLALRGFLQYVQGARKLKEDERLAKVKDALPLVTRPEEKRLAISVLGTIGSTGALEALQAFADDAATTEEACSALVGLAGKNDLKGVSKDDRQKALQTVIEKSKVDATKKRAEEVLKGLK